MTTKPKFVVQGDITINRRPNESNQAFAARRNKLVSDLQNLMNEHTVVRIDFYVNPWVVGESEATSTNGPTILSTNN